MELLNPQLDVVFKLLFTRNEHLLLSMLEAVLGERIHGLEVLNPTLPGDLSAEKVIVLDVLAKLYDGRRADVEMQMRVTDELPPRLVFYGAREFTKQLRRGESYSELCSTIVVAWLAQPLFRDVSQLHSVYELRERHSGRLFSNDLAIHILQLPAVTEPPLGSTSDSEQNLCLWARFLTAKTREKFEALARESAIMAKAVEALERISEDPEARRLAEEREDSLKLYNMSLARSERRGRQEALRTSIRRLCDAYDIELTAQRHQQLEAAETDLQALFDGILADRNWPERLNG
jgi:predicted transposase/invertase (TIGR01784 family)